MLFKELSNVNCQVCLIGGVCRVTDSIVADSRLITRGMNDFGKKWKSNIDHELAFKSARERGSDHDLLNMEAGQGSKLSELLSKVMIGQGLMCLINHQAIGMTLLLGPSLKH